LLVVDDPLRRLIHEQRGEQALRQVAHENGMRVLREDGVAKALAGITSLEEVLRVSHG
jgi:type II secretory ATPase GspE/PulE/Tfp pilus assembly ATPase PilB-like protein